MMGMASSTFDEGAGMREEGGASIGLLLMRWSGRMIRMKTRMDDTEDSTYDNDAIGDDVDEEGHSGGESA